MIEGIRLLLVDDRPAERMALRKLLALSQANAMVIGETGLGGEAVTAAEGLDPDVILISLEEPLARPLRILEALAMGGGAPIIAISSMGDRDCLRKAMRAGAKEYLVKPLSAEELGKTVESIFVAEQQRKSMLSSGQVGMKGQGEVITIFGAKGGTGKTTLSINLAVALSVETKRRVVLVDLNLEQGDVPIMLDMVPDHTIVDVVRIIDRLEADVDMIKRFLCQHSSGVEVLAAPRDVRSAEMIGQQHVAKIVELLAKSFDYVVIDTPPKLYGTVLTALELSSMILVVTSPEVPALKNTRIMLEMLKSQYSYSDKVKLVVNNAYMTDGVSHTEVGRVLDYPIFWKMPHDSLVVECIKLGKPCVQVKARGKIARNIIDLARTLAGMGKPQKKLFGIFNR